VNLSTLLVLVFLVGMWVALLAGPVLQNRGGGNRGGDSIKSFQRQLAVLDRSRPGKPAMVRSLSTAPSAMRQQAEAAARQTVRPAQVRARWAAQRRRRIVTVLSGAAMTTLALSVILSGPFLYLFMLSSALLVGYLALMFQVLHRQAEREMKVAFLPHRNAGAEPTMLLQLREATAAQVRR
jgi:hypothetical protein